MEKKKKVGAVERRNIFQDGPHLLCAVVCEKLLIEKDGVKTAVRIIDRFQHVMVVTGDFQATQAPVIEQDLFLLVRFKKGDAGGKHELRLEFNDPSGSITSPGSVSQTIHFDGGPNRGLDIVTPLHLRLDKEGIYWLDVFLDEVRVTRIPLELVIVVRRQAEARESPSRLH